MGIVFPFVNQKGVMSGAITGCLFGWLIFFGSKTDPKSDYLKNLIPSTIDMDQCRNMQWVDDVKNYTQSEVPEFACCESLARSMCESTESTGDDITIIDCPEMVEWYES